MCEHIRCVESFSPEKILFTCPVFEFHWKILWSRIRILAVSNILETRIRVAPVTTSTPYTIIPVGGALGLRITGSQDIIGINPFFS